MLLACNKKTRYNFVLLIKWLFEREALSRQIAHLSFNQIIRLNRPFRVSNAGAPTEALKPGAFSSNALARHCVSFFANNEWICAYQPSVVYRGHFCKLPRSGWVSLPSKKLLMYHNRIPHSVEKVAKIWLYSFQFSGLFFVYILSLLSRNNTKERETKWKQHLVQMLLTAFT